MAWLYLMVLGPAAAGIVLATVWWLMRGRQNGLPRERLGAFSLAAGLTLVFVGLAERLILGPLALQLDIPNGLWEWYADHRFAIPLWLGILGLVLLVFPIRTRSGRGAADLTPRTAVSFARGWWFITPAVVLTLIVALTVAAGTASERDEVTGQYTMYSVDLGGERGMGTSIYGWFYSVPALVYLTLLIGMVILDLVLISRPALDRGREQDVRIRTVRTRNVLLIATGALLVHLGLIFGSLAGTASVRSTFSHSEGAVVFWTDFAALQPALNWASSVAAALGFALWAAVALSAIPSRRPAPILSRS